MASNRGSEGDTDSVPGVTGQEAAELARTLMAAIGRHDLDAMRALDSPDLARSKASMPRAGQSTYAGAT